MSDKPKLYDYQEEGVRMELAMKRCINGDDMGTGKTVQSIVAIERAKATPCLVICPAALKVNWEREIKKFTNLRPLILTDSVNATYGYHLTKMDLYDVVICNYESLAKYFVVSLGEKPLKLKNFIFRNEVDILKSVIIDESARVKDPTTRQSKIIMGICQGKEYIYELTGTPVVNHATDMACQLAILGRIDEFGGYGEFCNRYGENENLEELNQKIHETCYFRREKKDVLKDLPELTRTTISVTLDSETQEEYDTCQKDLLTFGLLFSVKVKKRKSGCMLIAVVLIMKEGKRIGYYTEGSYIITYYSKR